MTENVNRADISMFEALQADQHIKTGVSQMAVFNDLNAVKTVVTQYKEKSKLYESLRREYEETYRKSEEMCRKLDKASEKARAEEFALQDKCWDALRMEVDRINKIEDATARKQEGAKIKTAAGEWRTVDERFYGYVTKNIKD
jgi:hypothetical protein